MTTKPTFDISDDAPFGTHLAQASDALSKITMSLLADGPAIVALIKAAEVRIRDLERAQAKVIEHAAIAERERIRQLADHHHALYTAPATATEPSGQLPFADLLAEPSVPVVPTEGTTP